LSVAIEFDSAKEARNREKHGISMARAAELFEQPFRETEDLRAEYGGAPIHRLRLHRGAAVRLCLRLARLAPSDRIAALGQPEGDRCLPSDRARLTSPRPVAGPIGGDSMH